MSSGPEPTARVAEELRAAAELLDQAGRAADARALRAHLEHPSDALPSLFVAGEDKRGKSCLVNALLRRADLSPVGVEVVTAAPITFRAAASPRARVFHYGERDGVEMEFEAARALATVAGNPRNEENVRAVELGVPSPALAELNLVDTPGVGGLESGHAALTLQSLRSADALLFVTEAGAPLRGEELSFLRRAAARVEAVIIVLTKVDKHRGWRQILSDDAAILREQAPRFAEAPMLGVSAGLALRALEIDDDPAEAEAIRDEAGLVALDAAIATHVTGRAATLREANLLRAAHGALGGVLLRTLQTLRSLDADGTGRDALETERGRLRELKSDRAGWPRLLDTEIRRLSLDRTEAASRGMIEIRRRFELRLRELGRDEQETLPGELVADLTALAGRLNEEAAARLTELVDRMISDLDETAELHRSIEQLTDDRLRAELEAVSIGDSGMTMSDKLSALSGMSTGRSLGSVAGMLVGGPIGLAIGLGLGAVFAFTRFSAGDQRAFTQAFTGWMSTQISQTQLSINTSFQRQMLDVQQEIRDTVTRALEEREREITESLQEGQRVAQQAASERAAATAGLRETVAALRGARKRIEGLLADLGAVEAVGGPPS